MTLSMAKLVLILLFPFVPAFAGVLGSASTSSSFHPVCSLASNSRPAALRGQRASLPFSEKALRIRSENWKWGWLSVPRWKWLQTDHLYIRTNGRLREVRKVALFVESFLSSVQAGSIQFRLTLHIFRDRESFARYASLRGRNKSVPFFDHDYQEVVTFLSSMEDRDLVLEGTQRVIEGFLN